MTIEQRSGEEGRAQFPVGMRVLAVDDDPICLLLLESLLRRCKYHVTTRTHAFAALSLLRENKKRFDLVISDVHMPDVDGFKLLELVGLEMDLPVIMLSAYGDTELVMKGVIHGACDYLLKPVRIEEMKNIWQHVIRKKKADHNEGHRQGVAGNQDADHKCNKKRKDQVEDEDYDLKGLENDDPKSQKKPRFVWTAELHSKFVAAVDHLGVYAVPKRILELMNVEKLTRENVASHLQKYKTCLRKISCMQRQHTDMVAAFHNTDNSFSTVNGMEGSYSLSGTPQFQHGAFTSFPYDGMLCNLNNPVCLGIQHQVNHTHLSGVALHAADHGAASIPRISNVRILNGMPVSYEFNQQQEQDNDMSVWYTGEVPVKDDHWLVAVQPPADHSLSYAGRNHTITPPDDASFTSELPLCVTDYQYQGSHSTGNIIGQERKHRWETFAAAPMHSSNLMPNPAGSSNLDHPVIASGGQVTNTSMPNGQGNINAIKQQTYVDSFPSYLNHGYQIGQRNPLEHRLPNNAGSLENVVSSMVKPPFWDSKN